MPAIALRSDWDAVRVRAVAREAENAGQVRRLLAIAAVYEGKNRHEAARVGAMDRQTLRDWVHRFNAAGPDGLIDRKAPGARARSAARLPGHSSAPRGLKAISDPPARPLPLSRPHVARPHSNSAIGCLLPQPTSRQYHRHHLHRARPSGHDLLMTRRFQLVIADIGGHRNNI